MTRRRHHARPLTALLAAALLGLAGCANTPAASSTTPTSTTNISPATIDHAALTPTQRDALWRTYRSSDDAQALLNMLENNAIVVGNDTMPIHTQLIWDADTPAPPDGYPVFISLHGGGAFTEIENHEQWEKQFTRYPGVRGLYICPHSPMDTWDQWHHERIVNLIDSLVRAVMLRDDIDPNRVYLGGYCSGGNGVYQLAPLLADRFAAASITKGIHEGGALINLRNLPIDVQWGEHDNEWPDRPAMNRANIDALFAMQRNDPDGYAFRDIEHWRQGRVVNDKSTMRWMSRYTRDPMPDRVVWQQDGDVRPESNPARHRFYWLGVDEAYALDGTTDLVDARLDRTTNTITLQARGYAAIDVYLNNQLLDLDRPVRVVLNGKDLGAFLLERSLEIARRELKRRGDPAMLFTAQLTIELDGTVQPVKR